MNDRPDIGLFYAGEGIQKDLTRVGKRMISAYVDLETYKKGRLSGINWATLVRMGLEKGETEKKFTEAQLMYEEMKAKQQRTAELLQKYVNGEVE